jgi:hypothetical protein
VTRGAVAAAVVLLVCLMFFWPGSTASATPAEIVRKAIKAHEAEVSREYLLSAELPPRLARRFPKLAEREVSLWTRGGRFRVEPGLGGGVWGRDEEGQVWIAPTPKAGAWFREDEIDKLPPRLKDAVKESLAVRSVRLPPLLNEVLQECELRRVSGEDGSSITLEASCQGGLKRATLVVGPGEVIQRMSLSRRLSSGEQVTVRLELVREVEKDDAFFRLEGNLAEGGKVFGPDRPAMRLKVLARLLGPT